MLFNCLQGAVMITTSAFFETSRIMISKILWQACPECRAVVVAGDVRNFSRWKNTLAHLDKGRYAADSVLDYLQNKDNKALVFTDKHLVYLNLKRQRLRWALPVANLSSITTHGQLGSHLIIHLCNIASGHAFTDIDQYCNMPSAKPTAGQFNQMQHSPLSCQKSQRRQIVNCILLWVIAMLVEACQMAISLAH